MQIPRRLTSKICKETRQKRLVIFVFKHFKTLATGSVYKLKHSHVYNSVECTFVEIYLYIIKTNRSSFELLYKAISILEKVSFYRSARYALLNHSYSKISRSDHRKFIPLLKNSFPKPSPSRKKDNFENDFSSN